MGDGADTLMVALDASTQVDVTDIGTDGLADTLDVSTGGQSDTLSMSDTLLGLEGGGEVRYEGVEHLRVFSGDEAGSIGDTLFGNFSGAFDVELDGGAPVGGLGDTLFLSGPANHVSFETVLLAPDVPVTGWRELLALGASLLAATWAVTRARFRRVED